MKILDTTLIVDPAVQQPFTGPSLKFVEDSYKEALDALARMAILDVTKVTVLYGCVNSTPGTTTFTLTAGALYYNGEIYLVPAATLTTAGNVVLANLVDTNTLGNQTFSDGIARTTSHDRTAVWALGTSGTGTLSNNSASDFNNIYTNNWFKLQITPGYVNSWGDAGGGQPQGRFKMDGRFVALDGIMTTAGGAVSNTTAFTLPAGYRPTVAGDYYLSVDPTDITKFAIVSVATSGVVNVKFTAGLLLVTLAGIRIPLD